MWEWLFLLVCLTKQRRRLELADSKACGKIKQMIAPRLSAEEFLKTETLCARNVSSIFGTDESTLPVLREWLDHAPLYAAAQTMALWGTMVQGLLWSLKHFPEDEGDTRRLVDYLDHMAGLDAEHWWVPCSFDASGDKKTPYAILRDVSRPFGSSGFHGAALLVKALDTKMWEPDALLAKLNTMQKQQIKEASSVSWVGGLQEGAQGFWLRALWTSMPQTSWRPVDTEVYGDMWWATELDKYDGDGERAAILATCTPSYNTRMLKKLLESTNISPEGVAELFPLHLNKCDAYASLDFLIGILTEGGRDDLTYKANIAAAQLHQYNPELSSVLQVHLALFPEANESNSMAEVSVPAFKALYGREVEPPLVLTGDFFGDSTGQPNGVCA